MNIRNEVIEKAKQYLGRTSGKEFCEWYNSLKGISWSTTGTPYCAIGVSYVLYQLGLQDIWEATASCPTAYRWAAGKGIWKDSRHYGGSYVPKTGDLVIYNWSPGSDDKDHIGFVARTEAGVMHTVEFNTRNTNSGTYGVWEKAYNLDSQYIRGYIALAYQEEAEADTYIVQGDTIAYIAERYGITADDLAKANNLASSQALTVGQVLTIPEAQEPDDGTWVAEVTADNLNVRTWAGTEYPNITAWPQLAKGNLVRVLGEQAAADGDIWYKVEIAETYIGFVHSAWLQRA